MKQPNTFKRWDRVTVDCDLSGEVSHESTVVQAQGKEFFIAELHKEELGDEVVIFASLCNNVEGGKTHLTLPVTDLKPAIFQDSL
tara:strand:- start:1375 stop:1629 length:255 start_codon:yes stop_codon:yes gene_type:complete